MTQHIDWSVVASYASKAWSGAGPLVGVVVGAWLGNRMHNRQSRVDDKKRDYQELLRALMQAHEGIAFSNSPGGSYVSPEYQRKWHEMAREGYRAIEDRLFIHEEVKKMKLQERWNTITKKFDEERDYDSFKKDVDEILDTVRASAKRLTG